MNVLNRNRFALSLTLLGLLMAPMIVAGAVLEEIVVTAQKREQNVQDVGIAITAFNRDQLIALGFTNAQEITALAPNVSTVQPNGEANYAIAIRGVANSDFTSNVESPIAVYVDEVYISQMSGAGFLMFDLERVEILRGPQGTLFGRNATGGLAHYISVKPSHEYGGFGDVTFGEHKQIKFKGAVGGGISENLAARLSIATHQNEGYVTNRLSGEKLNNANDFAARVQLLWTPSDDVEFLLNARSASQDIRTGFFEYVSALFPNGIPTPGQPNPDLGGYVDNDGDVFAGDYDFIGHNKLESSGVTGTLTWEFENYTFTSISDVQSLKRDYIEDTDSSPADYWNFYLTTDTEQFSQELRLNGETARMNWTTGLYYFDLDINDSNGAIQRGWFPNLLDLLGVPAVDPLRSANGLDSPYTITTESWSIFGQSEFSLTDKWSVIAGFRWTEEERKNIYANNAVTFSDIAQSGTDPKSIVATFAVYEGILDDGTWSAKLGLDYRPNDDLLLYASWNRGTKSGGFNAPFLPTDTFVIDDFMKYDPEALDAYEAGFKWSFMDGRARLNVSAYYYDYANYQAFTFIGLDTFTLNADAENTGFEAEFQASLYEGLDLLLGVGYIDVKVTNVPGITVDVPGVVTAILPGETLTSVQSPKWNVNGLVRYEWSALKGRVAIQADFQYRSETFMSLVPGPSTTQDGYAVSNAALSWTDNDDRWGARVFVSNLTNEKYVVQAFDISGTFGNGGFLVGMNEEYYGRPRWYGLSVRYNW